jgi:hypothetical protein
VSLSPDDRVLVKPLGVKGTVVRAAKVARTGRWVIRADGATQDVVWPEKDLEKLPDD